MQAGTIISYADDNELPHAEVTLRNGDRIDLILDRGGLAIRRSAASARPSEIVFQANAHQVSHLCAGLFSLEVTPKPTPLRILVAAVV
jgi:hypothetical protein